VADHRQVKTTAKPPGRAPRVPRAAAGDELEVIGPAGDGRNLRRQGRATRARLLEAAVPALAEHGFHAARVDDVVRLAGVSHGTFYLYFANKEDLFRALAEQCADEAAVLAASLGRVPEGSEGHQALRSWLAEFFEFYRRYGVVIRAWAENQVVDRELARLGVASFGRIADTLRQSIASAVLPAGAPAARTKPARPGGVRPAAEVDARAVELRADALLALIERFAYIVTSRELGFDPDQMLDDLARLVQRGFFQPLAS
jgi:AcrR family transcriptional regulator